LQVYLDHLVKEVWCKAAADFSLDLLHPELREIVLEIYNTEEDRTRGKTKDWLYGPIQTIYNIFKTQLNPDQRDQVVHWYDHNNDIAALCAGDPDTPPATYDDIAEINNQLATALKEFCKSLFSTVSSSRRSLRELAKSTSTTMHSWRKTKKGNVPTAVMAISKGCIKRSGTPMITFSRKGFTLSIQ